ncbi:MAG: phosphopantetheine adenylyltransferase [Methanomicrobiales archaeon]|nr:phosphopantetheine adenylyltransferase [Methanomicrobiales archaeon]
MKVMVGGTFSPFHAGHRRLLERAFSLAGRDGQVVIGLTTDEFAGRKRHPVMPFADRRRTLAAFIGTLGDVGRWEIQPLVDRHGTAVEDDFDALVVSEETAAVAMEINRLRQERGRRKVDIHQIACVFAEDGRWISSTRILAGEIDPDGHVVKEKERGKGRKPGKRGRVS